ncbi:MAG: DUF2461 domain-containing protein [Bryobacteraceae bacterium]
MAQRLFLCGHCSNYRGVNLKPNFPGFPPEAIQFFRGLARNNNRDWFQPRKERFETHIKEPMVNLVTALNSELAKFAPEYVSDPKKAIFRIYRDTRFSADKTPYKDHIAASFSRRGLEKTGAGGFYFSVNHKEIEIAGGIYHPPPETMLAVRTHIAETHERFRRILSNRKLRQVLGELRGSELSRVPKGFDPSHAAADLIRKKDWILFVSLDPELATSPRLFDEIVTRFRAASPLLEYLNTPMRPRKASPYSPADYF